MHGLLQWLAAAVAVGIMAASLWWDLCGRIRKFKREIRG